MTSLSNNDARRNTLRNADQQTAPDDRSAEPLGQAKLEPSDGLTGDGAAANDLPQPDPNPRPDDNDATAPPAEPSSVTPAGQPCNTPLIVEMGDVRHEIVPVYLAAPGYREEQLGLVRGAPPTPIFDLRHLLAWSDQDRWAALSFISVFEAGRYQARARADAEPQDLLGAVLDALVGDTDVQACGRGVLAAVEAAALAHPQALEPACTRINRQLRELQVEGYTTTRLLRQAQRLASTSGASSNDRGAEDEAVLVRTVLTDAPVPADAIVPAGWQLSLAGIARSDGQTVREISSAPLVITRRFTAIDGGAESLGIAWFRDGRWHEEIAARTMIATSKSVVELAAFGAPITSNNAADVVQFFADFEAANLEVLPRACVTGQLGWKGEEGRSGFLLGRQLIQVEVAAVAGTMGQDGSAEAVARAIVFKGADDGDEQLADGFRAAGTFAGWRNAIRGIEAYSRVKLAIYASLSVPLLEIFNAYNFVLSYAGATSQGKTTTLRIAASCWGCPDERSPTSVVGTWDATRVWFVRAPEVINDLPLCIDDTKRARRREEVAQVLYDVTSGRGRGRGSQAGLGRVNTYRTVMLTTGEAPITSFSQDGGTRPRVLELWGSPFHVADWEVQEESDEPLEPGEGVDLGQSITAVNEAILAHHGHAGPAFVRYLIANRQRWSDWRDTYRELRADYEHRAGGNAVAGRMAAHLAVVSMAAVLAQQANVLPWSADDVVNELWDQLTAEAPEADRAAAAVRYVLSWAHGHSEQFEGQVGSHAHPPAQGWAGRWDGGHGVGRESHWTFIGFLPHCLDQVLEEGGFEPEPIKRLWRDRGWLMTSPERGFRYRIRLMGKMCDLIAIRRSAIEEVQGLPEDESQQADIVAFPQASPPAAGA